MKRFYEIDGIIYNDPGYFNGLHSSETTRLNMGDTRIIAGKLFYVARTETKWYSRYTKYTWFMYFETKEHGISREEFNKWLSELR